MKQTTATPSIADLALALEAAQLMALFEPELLRAHTERINQVITANVKAYFAADLLDRNTIRREVHNSTKRDKARLAKENAVLRGMRDGYADLLAEAQR